MPAQPGTHFHGRHRARVQIALCLVHAECGEDSVLFLLLDAFCHNSHPKGVGDVHHGPDHGAVTRVIDNIVDETFIYLHFVDWQALQIRQRRVAGPEIIYGEFHSESAKLVHTYGGKHWILDDDTFREFKSE